MDESQFNPEAASSCPRGKTLEAHRAGPWRGLLLLAVLVMSTSATYRHFFGVHPLVRAGWTQDWPSAVDASTRSGKPALLLFTADWCPACKTLESGALADEDVQNFIRDHFTPVVVDVSDPNSADSRRAAEMGVGAIPALILYDKSGDELARGFAMPPDVMLMWLKTEGKAVKFSDAR